MQELRDLIDRDRLAIEITLRFDTSLEIEAPHLCFGLYAFRRCGHAEAGAEARDRAARLPSSTNTSRTKD